MCLPSRWIVFTLPPKVERGRQASGIFLEECRSGVISPWHMECQWQRCPWGPGLLSSEACRRVSRQGSVFCPVYVASILLPSILVCTSLNAGSPPCDRHSFRLASLLEIALYFIASVNEETEVLSCGGLFPGVWQSPAGPPFHTPPMSPDGFASLCRHPGFSPETAWARFQASRDF